RRHTRWPRDWSSDVCSSDLGTSTGDSASKLRGEKPAEVSANATTNSAPKLEDLRKRAASLNQQITDRNQRLMHLDYIAPVPPVAHAVRDAAEPADCRVNIRGNPRA